MNRISFCMPIGNIDFSFNGNGNVEFFDRTTRMSVHLNKEDFKTLCDIIINNQEKLGLSEEKDEQH